MEQVSWIRFETGIDIGCRWTCLHYAIEGLQLATHVRRAAAAYAVDEDPTLVEPVRDGESIVIVDFILVKRDMEDPLLLLLLLIFARAAVVVVVVAPAGFGIGRGAAWPPLHFGIDGLSLGQPHPAAGTGIGDVVAAQYLQIHKVAQVVQQAGGMRQRHALHRVLVDGQQLIPHVDLSVLVRNAT